MQSAVADVDPEQAALWKAAASDNSLAFELHKAGLMETTQRVHEERMATDAAYISQQASEKAKWEQEMLDNMEAGALRAREALNAHLKWGGNKPISDSAGGGMTIGQQLQQAANAVSEARQNRA